MAHFEQQIPIIREGWDRLPFYINGHLVSIPDDVMLDELIRFPQPHKILSLLSIYEASVKRRKDVDKILDDTRKQPSWKLINKALKGTNSERLYIVLSQNTYRLTQSFDLESQEVLQFASNAIINYLHHNFSFPTGYDLYVKEMCDKHGQYFETYRFARMVQRYCDFMLPHPCRSRFNREENSHISLYKPMDLYGEKEWEILNRENAENCRTMERFSLYRYAVKVIDRIVESLTPDEKEIFDSSWFVSTDNLHSNTRKIAIHQRNQRKEQKARIQAQNEPILSPVLKLHQCVFCYRFKFEPLPPQGNDFKQHCDRKECKKAYDRWLRHINRLEIRLTKKETVD